MKYKGQKIILLIGLGLFSAWSSVLAKNFTIFNATNVNQPYFSVNGTSGNVGIGLTNPSTLLQITNNNWISAINGAGNGVVNMFKVNANNQIEVGAPLNIGSFEFSEDSGLVTFADMPVSAAATIGTPESYIFKVDGSNILSIYSEADGVGGIQNKRVGIGTSSPLYTLDVAGAASFNNNIIHGVGTPLIASDAASKGYIDSALSATGASLWASSTAGIFNVGFGNVGIGTTAPGIPLNVNGGSGNSQNTIGLTTQTYVDSSSGSVLLFGQGASSGNTYGVIRQLVNGGTSQGNLVLNPVAGNVGIGTTNPESILHLNKSVVGGVGPSLYLDNTAASTLGNSADILFSTWSGESAGSPGAKISLVNTSAGTGANAFTFFTKNTSGVVSEKVRFDSQGNVGIGISPSSNLDVYRNDAAYAVNIGDANNRAVLKLRASNAGTEQLTVTRGSGIMQLQGVGVDGVTTYSIGLNPFGGNIGIGTNTPVYKLDVNGTGSFNQPVIVGTPIFGTNAATKSYVDSAVSGSGASLWASSTAGTYNVGLGNVGIGISNPQAKLQIGSVGATGYGASNGLTFGDGTRAAALNVEAAGLNIYSSSNIVFSPSTSEKMRIDTNGNVGIGTTGPEQKLGVALDGTDNKANGIQLVVPDSAIGSARIGLVTNTAGNNRQQAYIRFDKINTGVARNSTISFYTNDSGVTADGDAGALRMLINNYGNVGIATTTPLYKLDVNGTGSFNQPVIVGTPTIGTHAATKNYVDSALSGGSGSTVGYWAMNGANINNSNGGNVGIGTSTPGAKLDVNGGVSATGFGITGTSASFSSASGYANLYGYTGSALQYYNGSSVQNGLTLNNGNIGIGTSLPGSRLHVKNGAGGSVPASAFDIMTVENNAVGYVNFITPEANRSGFIFSGSTRANGGFVYTNADPQFGASYVQSLVFLTNGFQAGMALDASGNLAMLRGGNITTNGNIGIATTPLYKLDVNGTGSFNQPVIVGTPISGTNAATKNYVDSAMTGAASTFWASSTAGTYNVGLGNVGVGTTAPSYPLHIVASSSGTGMGLQSGSGAGSLKLGADVNAGTLTAGVRKLARITMPSFDAGATNVMLFSGDVNGTDLNDVYFGGTPGGSQYAATGLHFITAANGTTFGGTERVTILNNGNVGIGTTTPLNKLQIGGNGSVGYSNNLFTAGDATTAYAIRLTGNVIEHYSSGDTSFLTGITERMRLTSAGNVGIATTTPLYKLDVNGTGSFNQPVIVGTPTIGTHAATKNYVDSAMTGAANTFWASSTLGTYNVGLGNVGIGTTNPNNYKLNIAGRIYSSGASLSVNQDSVATEDSTSNLLFKPGATNLSNLSVYSNCTKTYLGNGKWRFVNNGSATTLIRFFTNLSDLINGETYAVGVNYENLSTGGITIDWNDSATTGVVRATSAGSTSGRLYGTASKAVYDTTYHFFDVQLDVNTSVDLYAEQVEYKNYATSFVPGDRGAGDLVLGGKLQSYATSSSYFYGNLGIGTTNPNYKLDVINGAVEIAFNPNTSLGAGVIGTVSNHPFHVVSNNNIVQTISTTGNIGIATTTPLYKLDVVGAGNFNSNIIHGVGTPLVAADAAPKSYVDSALSATGASLWASSTAGIYNVGLTGNVGIGTTNPGYKLDVSGQMRAERYRGINSLVLNTYATINPASNVFLYSQPNDRDSWLYLDSADTGSNWGIYHRQIDSVVSGLPGNSIGFIGGGSSALQAYISLADGSAYFKGNVGIGTTAPHSQLEIASPGGAGDLINLNKGTGSGGLKFTFDGTNWTSYWRSYEQTNNGNLSFGVADTSANTNEVLRLHSSGQIFVGLTSHSIDAVTAGAYLKSTNTGLLSLGLRAASVDTNILNLYNGNVGIATSTPLYKLDVVGAGNFNSNIIHGVGTPLAVDDATSKGYVDSALSATGASLWASSTAGTYNVGLGNVGIGMTNPANALDVNGNINAASFFGRKFSSKTSAYFNVGTYYYLFSVNPASNGSAASGDFEIYGNGGSQAVKGTITSKNSGGVTSADLNIYSSNTGNYTIVGYRNPDNYTIDFYFTPLVTVSFTESYTASNLMGYAFVNSNPPASPAANTFSWSSGKIGIGTGNPAAALHVVGDGTSSAVFMSGNVGIGTTNPAEKLQISSGNVLLNKTYGIIWGDSNDEIRIDDRPAWLNRTNVLTSRIYSDGVDGSGAFVFGRTTGTIVTPLMTILSEGNIGIGTTTPLYKFDVNGTGSFNQPVIVGTPTIGTHAATKNYVDSALSGGSGSTVGYWAMNGTNINSSNAGNVGIGTTNPGQKLEVGGNALFNSSALNVYLRGNSAGDPAISFSRYPGADLSLGAKIQYVMRSANIQESGALAFWTNPNTTAGTDLTERMRIDSAGNVGIGTTAPGSGNMLNVKGLTPTIATGYGNSTGNMGQLVLESSDGYATQKGGRIAFSGNAGNNGGAFTGHSRQDSVFGTIEGFKANASANNAGGGLIFKTNYNPDGQMYERMRITDSGNVGIGTTNPRQKLHINVGTDQNLQIRPDWNGTTGLALNATNDASSLTVPMVFNASQFSLMSGSVGIATTTPLYKLDVVGAGSFNSNIIHGVGTPLAVDDAAPKSYVDSAISATGASLWASSAAGIYNVGLTGNVGIGTTAPYDTLAVEGIIGSGKIAGNGEIRSYQDVNSTVWVSLKTNTATHKSGLFRSNTNFFAWYDTNTGATNIDSTISTQPIIFNNSGLSTELMRITASGNVGIGTTSPLYKLDVNGAGSFSQPVIVGSPIAANHAATKSYVDSVTLNVSNVNSTTAGGDLNMAGKNILNVNKLTVNTIDPLYTLNGINYSTYAPSMSGGVKEEYVGKAVLTTRNENNEYEKVIDFSKEPEGTDLWVWRQVIDYNFDNVEVMLTSYGKFANTYYLIKGNKLILRSDKPVTISYRLIGSRFDWLKWPTKALNQSEKGMLVTY